MCEKNIIQNNMLDKFPVADHMEELCITELVRNKKNKKICFKKRKGRDVLRLKFPFYCL